MDFTMIFSRSSFIQVFGGVAPPPTCENHPKTWWNLEPSWLFPGGTRWLWTKSESIMGSWNESCTIFQTALKKRSVKIFPPPFFVVPKMLCFSDLHGIFPELFWAETWWLIFGMMLFPPRSQCCVLTWHCIQGPWDGWWQCSEIRSGRGWKGDGPGWERMHFPQGFPHGVHRVQTGAEMHPNLEVLHGIFFPVFYVLSRGGYRPTMKNTRERDEWFSEALQSTSLWDRSWSRDVLKFKEFFTHARKNVHLEVGGCNPNCRRIVV